MTNEEIIELAKQAGFERLGHDDYDYVCYPDDIEAFAKLVAEKEHERFFDAAMKSTEKAVDVAMALEREACAKIADAYVDGLERNYSEIIAEKIRARGQE
jgi:hypothetical protein